MSARACIATALVAGTLAVAPRADGQARPAVLEARGDVLAGSTTSWQGGAGAAWWLGRRVQLGVVAAGGVTTGLADDVDPDGTTPSGRAELVARFVVDPEGAAARRWYGGAGAGAHFAHGSRGVARVHAVVGVESRPRGRLRLAAEVGVGGGVRVGVALRRTEPAAE